MTQEKILRAVGTSDRSIAPANLASDQQTIARLLANISSTNGGWKETIIALSLPLPSFANGTCDPLLAAAILNFQQAQITTGKLATADGVVDPNGRTLSTLNSFALGTSWPGGGSVPVPGSSGLRIDDRKDLDGVFEETTSYLVPESVNNLGKLVLVSQKTRYGAKFVVSDSPTSPNRFLVIYKIPFAPVKNVHVLFHGNPGFAGYSDSSYFFNPAWDSDYIHAYHQYYGGQLSASRRKRMLILPLFRGQDLGTCGTFAANYRGVINDCLQLVNDFHEFNTTIANFEQLSLTSFSAGIKYLHTFLRKADGLDSNNVEVQDFDGAFSSYKAESRQVRNMTTQAYSYNQEHVGQKSFDNDVRNGIYHLNAVRWPNGQNTDIHHKIPSHAFYHALESSAWTD